MLCRNDAFRFGRLQLNARLDFLMLAAWNGHMRCMSPLASGLAGFLGGELMRSPSLMGRKAAFTTCFAGLLGSKLVGSALFVSSPSSFARNLSLFFRVHTSETALAFHCHDSDPSVQTDDDESATVVHYQQL
jgi:hypothetical protein